MRRSVGSVMASLRPRSKRHAPEQRLIVGQVGGAQGGEGLPGGGRERFLRETSGSPLTSSNLWKLVAAVISSVTSSALVIESVAASVMVFAALGNDLDAGMVLHLALDAARVASLPAHDQGVAALGRDRRGHRRFQAGDEGDSARRRLAARRTTMTLSGALAKTSRM